VWSHPSSSPYGLSFVLRAVIAVRWTQSLPDLDIHCSFVSSFPVASHCTLPEEAQYRMARYTQELRPTPSVHSRARQLCPPAHHCIARYGYIPMVTAVSPSDLPQPVPSREQIVHHVSSQSRPTLLITTPHLCNSYFYPSLDA